jgi:hypothetical protein
MYYVYIYFLFTNLGYSMYTFESKLGPPLVAGIVMFNIMELIMEIMPNYPTLILLTCVPTHSTRT